ncbi:restriction endonuclease subunit S [Photobacterium damselae]|uniref:restriction endonuclease subunit S n=1 Tax=Photobacterium damselae TaxID=38293 RepID=UPI003D7CA954
MTSRVKFSEIAELVMGQSPKGSDCNDSGDGFPLLNGPTEFTERSPLPVQFTTVGKKFSKVGDILFCVRGSTTGRMNYADQTYAIGRGIGAIRGINGYPTAYVRAVLERNLDRLLVAATGSTFPNVGKDLLNNFEVDVCSPEQAQNVNILLVAIEDKRYLNTQTNQTLEEMAQAIFRSWFVDFDPVKAKMNGEQPEGMDAATASLFPEKLVESELGLTPEGWPVGKLSELIKFANGKSGKKSDCGRFPLYGANGIIGFSEEAKFEDAVIIGRVGAYCGAIEYCNSQFWASDNTIVATAKSGKAQLPFVLYLLKHLDLNQHAGGAAQPLLNQKVLNSLEIPIPTDAVLEKYSELLSTMLEKMAHNIEENHNLERLRDTLLPKLLSGEIELD